MPQGFKNLKTVLKVILVLVIPSLLLGFNLFEQTPFYKRLIGSLQIEGVLASKFLTQYEEPGQLVLRRGVDSEFEAVWGVIRSNTSATLPADEPTMISRIAVENAAFVTLPQRGRVALVPESVPLFVFYCLSLPAGCSEQSAVRVGTIGDLRAWAQGRADWIRLALDVVVSLLSIIVGLLVEFPRRSRKKSSKNIGLAERPTEQDVQPNEPPQPVSEQAAKAGGRASGGPEA